ncbi:ABC transporter ATP-binding protein [Citrobacter sp. FP75]|uniref:ABC transporter ATP-binding protein n=1 Tax=Citrobacter sp. FP75 TaxID=1852949 RepID=UPI001BC91B3E|nr:ABC transporter ATP-binding protein [Citrobacter sp. FP75]
MITFEHVTKSYPGQNLSGNTLRTALRFRRPPRAQPFISLNDVSFSLPAGEALGVIGHNGAGKSTLLKLLTRVTRPTSGKIRVNGSMSSLLEVGAGFHHDLSGWENISLASAILGMSSRQMRQHLEEIVTFSELEAHLDKPVRTYSSGMFLRLAFSLGIHLPSDILVIDEALVVGDQTFQAKCLAKIADFKQRGGTLVLVSHDCQQLLATCDRGLVLTQGHVHFDGEIHQAIEHYNLLTEE